jgi:hypothetical protein
MVSSTVKAAMARGDLADVAGLAAGFGVERRAVEHDDGLVAGVKFR